MSLLSKLRSAKHKPEARQCIIDYEKENGIPRYDYDLTQDELKEYLSKPPVEQWEYLEKRKASRLK